MTSQNFFQTQRKKIVLLLTYGAALEIAWNPSARPNEKTVWRLGENFLSLEFRLGKQESIAYLRDGSGFLATTEAGDDGDAPIVSALWLAKMLDI